MNARLAELRLSTQYASGLPIKRNQGDSPLSLNPIGPNMDSTTSAHRSTMRMMVVGLRRVSRKALSAVVLNRITRLHRRSEPTLLTSRPVRAIGCLEPVSRTFGFRPRSMLRLNSLPRSAGERRRQAQVPLRRVTGKA
jgi:hypothetical protein